MVKQTTWNIKIRETLEQRKLKKDVLINWSKTYGEVENTENNESVYSSKE